MDILILIVSVAVGLLILFAIMWGIDRATKGKLSKLAEEWAKKRNKG